MLSAVERLKIFENIRARVGSDADVLGEYAKAMSALNGLQTMTEMTPPPTMPPQGQNVTSEPPFTSGSTTTPLGDAGLSTGLNQPM